MAIFLSKLMFSVVLTDVNPIFDYHKYLKKIGFLNFLYVLDIVSILEARKIKKNIASFQIFNSLSNNFLGGPLIKLHLEISCLPFCLSTPQHPDKIFLNYFVPIKIKYLIC